MKLSNRYTISRNVEFWRKMITITLSTLPILTLGLGVLIEILSKSFDLHPFGIKLSS